MSITTLDTLYIIEEDNDYFDEYIKKLEKNHDAPYTPNFITGSDLSMEALKSTSKISTNALKITAGALASKVAIGYLPSLSIQTLVGPLGASLYNIFSENLEEAKAQKEREIQALEIKLKKMSLSKLQAHKLGFKFPPGHSKIGEFYKLHPLATISKYKQNIYLPAHSFEDVLLEEREAELLTLLVDLGASEIEITKSEENLLTDTKKSKLNVGVPSLAEISTGVALSSEEDTKDADKRIFQLKGKNWDPDVQIKRDKYFWLEFEPSWNTLVTARQQGACTRATIEVKQSALYSDNKEILLQAKIKMSEAGATSAGGEMQLLKKDFQETSYIVNVKFPE